MKYNELNQQVATVIADAAKNIAQLKGYEVIVSYRRKPQANILRPQEDVLHYFFVGCCLAVDVQPIMVRDHTREGKYLTIRQAIIVVMKAKYKENAPWKKIAECLGYETMGGVIKAYTTGMGYKTTKDGLFTQYYNQLKQLL